MAKKRKLPIPECHDCGHDMQVVGFDYNSEYIDLVVTVEKVEMKIRSPDGREINLDFSTPDFKEWVDAIGMFLDGMFPEGSPSTEEEKDEPEEDEETKQGS